MTFRSRPSLAAWLAALLFRKGHAQRRGDQGLSDVPNMRTSTNGAFSQSAPASAMRDLLIANQLTVADYLFPTSTTVTMANDILVPSSICTFRAHCEVVRGSVTAWAIAGGTTATACCAASRQSAARSPTKQSRGPAAPAITGAGAGATS